MKSFFKDKNNTNIYYIISWYYSNTAITSCINLRYCDTKRWPYNVITNLLLILKELCPFLHFTTHWFYFSFKSKSPRNQVVFIFLKFWKFHPPFKTRPNLFHFPILCIIPYLSSYSSNLLSFIIISILSFRFFFSSSTSIIIHLSFSS